MLKNIRCWLLLILFLSVASIRRKLLIFDSDCKKINKNPNILWNMNKCVGKKSMIIGCNIWMICLELNWLFYDPSWILQLCEFVWMLRSLVGVVFNHFLLIDATDRSKICSNHHRIFFNISLYLLLSFLANISFQGILK